MKVVMMATQIYNKLPRGRGYRCQRAGFTLIELMLVIGVIVALTAMTLPAFRSLKEGNRESGGINAVSAALNAARTLAVRDGHDVAVMFMFDVERQICSMQLIEAVGVTYDADGSGNGEGWGKATIFVPVPGKAPIEMPVGAAVLGYGYGATRLSTANLDNAANWYTELGQLYEDREGEEQFNGRDPWLFPRTDIRMFADDGKLSEAKNADMEYLETFIIRFSSEGTVVSSAEELANGTSSDANDGYLELDHLHTDYGRDWQRDSHIWSPIIFTHSSSNREVIAEMQVRSVPFLAVVDLYKIGAEIGVRSPWLAVGKEHDLEGGHAVWDADGNGEPDHLEIDQWINDNATILTFNRYTGTVMKEFRR